VTYVNQLHDLSDEDQQKIMSKNLAEFLRLPA
jgi:hypothetical protein